MISEQAKQNFIVAIIAIFVSGGVSIADLTVGDAVNELEGYYVCPLTVDVQQFARLSSSEERGYPYIDSTKGYKDCKRGTERGVWQPIKEYADSIGLDPYDLLNTPESTNQDENIDNLLVQNATAIPIYVPPTEVELPVWNSIEQYQWNNTHVWLNYTLFAYNDRVTDFNSTTLTFPSAWSNGSTISINLIQDTIFKQSFTNISLRDSSDDISVNYTAPTINFTDVDWNITGTGQYMRSFIPQQAGQGLISCISYLGDGCELVVEDNCGAIFK